MNTAHYGDTCPICALASARGAAALSLIRCSGDNCINAAAEVFSRPKDLREAQGNTIVYGHLLDSSGTPIDQVLISVFRAPKSSTGEEALEISCHGSMAIVYSILQTLKTAGFRDALAGEFTFRAFINGKLDLTGAEAVMELVASKTDTAREHALKRLEGHLKTEIETIKQSLMESLAACELFLDYSEDDGVSLSADDPEVLGTLPLRGNIETAIQSLQALSASYKSERLYNEGALVALAGRPNAGKSSLFNRLLKEERSIVSETEGTTRDWIECQIALQGIPIRLVDTAGLRDSCDHIEQHGVQRSKAILEEADLILYLVDGTQGETPEDTRFGKDIQGKPILRLWTKSEKAAKTAPEGYIAISAHTGEGLDTLIHAAVTELGTYTSDLMAEASLDCALSSRRQKELVDSALQSCQETLRLANTGMPLDLSAPELQEAVHALGQITGEVASEDILDLMFSRFCIGK